MVLIKAAVPPALDDMFRRAVSARRGVRKGALRGATLAAMAKYSGIDPAASLVASPHSLTVEAPPSLMDAVVQCLLPKRLVCVDAHQEPHDIMKILGMIKVLYQGKRYTYFEYGGDARKLQSLRSFRAEWEEHELIFEEDCVNMTVRSLEGALHAARQLAPILGLHFPVAQITERLELYRWEGVPGQEEIVR